MATMRALPALLVSVSLAAAGDRSGGATLEVANRKVFTFRASAAGNPPEERLATARARIEQLPTRGPLEPIVTRPLQLGSDRGTAVMVGPRLAFVVVDGDVDLQGGETTEGVARQAAETLSEALAAEREQRSWRLLLRSLLLAAVATLSPRESSGCSSARDARRRSGWRGTDGRSGSGCGAWTSVPPSGRRCEGRPSSSSGPSS